MKNSTHIDKILLGSLKLWLESNKQNEKFIDLLDEIETIEPEFQPKYEIVFLGPFNNKTRYYYYSCPVKYYYEKSPIITNFESTFLPQKNDSLKIELLA